LILFLATGAGSGYSPVAPGTVGSGVGILLFGGLAFGLGFSQAALLGVLVLITAVGVWSAHQAEILFSRKDDHRITVDEVVGMWVALIGLPLRIDVLIVGFLLFRVFDIWKPPPARLCESLGGGVGVIADDLVAGLYANVAGRGLWLLLAPEGLL